MSELQHITYISSAAREMDDDALETLLLDARAFNASVGVTGVLPFNGAAFLQYFEGSPEACSSVYARILASSAHHAIVELGNAPIADRQFASWLMGYSAITRSQWLELSKADWLANSDGVLHAQGPESDGVRLLFGFWQAAVGSA